MATATSVRVMGHEFTLMTDSDFDGLAGAEEGSYVCYTDSCVLVLSPDGTQIAEIGEDGTQIEWTVPYNPFTSVTPDC